MNKNFLKIFIVSIFLISFLSVLVFDLDETIGSFTELNILFNTIQDILQNNNNFTDVSFEIKVGGGGGGGNMDYTTTGYNVFGNVKIYGIV